MACEVPASETKAVAPRLEKPRKYRHHQSTGSKGRKGIERSPSIDERVIHRDAREDREAVGHCKAPEDREALRGRELLRDHEARNYRDVPNSSRGARAG
jgi:hypothetical protein